jgi:RHS repeat-associated protein
MSNQTPHCEVSQSAVRGGALQRGATIDFAYYTWWRWDLGWSAVTQYADTDTDWTVEGFNRFFVPFGHAALAEADVTTTPANAAYNYLAQDHLGTGRFVYNQAKTETASVEHLPYGDRYAATGDAPYHEFTGKPWDDDAGLFYFPYRYYAPTIGRWTTPDPAGMIDGPNVYGYVSGSPVQKRDALGLQALPPNFWPPFNGDPPIPGRLDLQGCDNAAPESADSLICNIYGPSDTFWGYGARCVCENAGDSDWDKAVRGCLACAKKKGLPSGPAHKACYTAADKKFGKLAGKLAQADIGIRLTHKCLANCY